MGFVSLLVAIAAISIVIAGEAFFNIRDQDRFRAWLREGYLAVRVVSGVGGIVSICLLVFLLFITVINVEGPYSLPALQSETRTSLTL